MKPPLYITGYVNEKPLVGGVFKLRDQEGFPLDMAVDLFQEKGWLIDYSELLSDAWLNDCLKYDHICIELRLLELDHVIVGWKRWGMKLLGEHPEWREANPIDEFCKFVMKRKTNIE